jgi:hypothetical protein
MQDRTGWQPIETAPRDGSWFVIVDRDGHCEAGRYDPPRHTRYVAVGDGLFRAEEVVTYEWDGFNNFHRATHWVPLPEPPNAE